MYDTLRLKCTLLKFLRETYTFSIIIYNHLCPEEGVFIIDFLVYFVLQKHQLCFIEFLFFFNFIDKFL